MSRIGRSPIQLPKGVETKLMAPGKVSVKGPKGNLEVVFSPRLELLHDAGALSVTRPTDHREDRAQHGLARSLIANAVTGVTEGYEKKLEIHGVGFRCANKGSNLELSLGYSHQLVVNAPAGITISATEPTRITVSGTVEELTRHEDLETVFLSHTSPAEVGR